MILVSDRDQYLTDLKPYSFSQVNEYNKSQRTQVIVNDKFYLTFTITDAHGRVRYLAAYAARGRREVNDKIKIILSFTIIS